MDWKEKVHYSDLPPEIQQDVKTKRNWALEGMVPVAADCGKEIYSNRFHQGRFHYFGRDEVRPGTPDELEIILGAEKKRRKELAKERREQQRQLVESLRHQVEVCAQGAYNQRRLQWVQDILDAYGDLCKHIAATDAPHPTPTRRIVIDTETTDPSADYGEILQLSIIDADTEAQLFNEYFKPFFTKEWPKAEAIHHITPAMVADKPYFAEKITEIQKIISTVHTVIGYDVCYDLSFLEAAGCSFPADTYVDVMQDFAPIYGEWDEYHKKYRWQKLSVCADYYNYDWGTDTAHDSLADCRATLYCYKKLQQEEGVKH